jgi:FkbM family methyltransferase
MTFAAQVRYLRSQPGFQNRPVQVLLRLTLWRMLCALHRPVSIRLPARDLLLYLPPDWHGTAKLLYVFRDDFEPDLAVLRNYLGAKATMVDVGANYGMFSLVASRLVGESGRVLAFEPANATFAVLKRNLESNDVRNVTPFRMALSDSAGTMRLYHDVDATRNSLAPTTRSQDFEEVQTGTLDEVLAKAHVHQVDFIKIDVEGADELVCRGAMNTLRVSLPVVLFEHNAPAADRMKLEARNTGKVLADLGYEFYLPGPQLVRAEGRDLPEGNILAVHPRRPKDL